MNHLVDPWTHFGVHGILDVSAVSILARTTYVGRGRGMPIAKQTPTLLSLSAYGKQGELIQD